MIAKKQKAIEYARSLFCEVKEDGQKKYTLHDIAKLVLKKCKFETTLSTIGRWAQKYDWEDTFTKLKQAGIERAKGDIDNKIIDEKANTIADIYQANKKLEKLAQQTILARMTGQKLTDKDGNEVKSDVGNTDIIRLIQHSESTLLALHDKKIDKGSQPDLSSMTNDELLDRLKLTQALEKKK
jgi:hypothetical protein